jgi:hypothetical protein
MTDKLKMRSSGLITRKQLSARKRMDMLWRLWLLFHRLTIKDVRAGGRLKFLYRYLRIQEDKDFDRKNLGYLASSIIDGVIYVPVASEFNDPWEASPAVRFPIEPPWTPIRRR